jgi:hypothetical protein
MARVKISGYGAATLFGAGMAALFGVAVITAEEGQRLLTPLFVFFSIGFSVTCCLPAAKRDASKELDLFHPSVLFLIFYLTYFVFSGVLVWLLNGYQSSWVNLGSRPAFVVNTLFFLGALSVAAFALGLQGRTPAASRIALLHRGPFRRREFPYVIAIFLAVGLASSLYHLASLGELSLDVLLYLSPSARRDLGLNLSNALIILESMLGWSALLAAFYCIMQPGMKKRWAAVVLVAVAILITYVISGKRSAVFPLLLLPLIWSHYIVEKLRVRTAVIYFAIGMIVISGLLLIRIAVPLMVRNVDVAENVASDAPELLLFYLEAPEWSTFDMVAASLLRRDDLLLAMDGSLWASFKYTFGTLLIVVPRAIWPDKPLYEDPGQIYYQLLTGSNEEIGFAVTAWGTSLLLFHVPGLLVGMFVFGWFVRTIYLWLRPWEKGPYSVFLYGMFYWMTFQFLRFGTLGFTILLFAQTMLMGLLAALFLSRKTRFSQLREQRNDHLVA